MSILLPIEPIMLCHFDMYTNKNHFKGTPPSMQDQIGTDTSIKNFGRPTKNIQSVLSMAENGFDPRKSFTFQLWKYTKSIMSDRNGSGDAIAMSFGGVGSGTFYIDSSNNYCIEVVKTNPPWAVYTEIRDMWSVSSDLNQWVHLEFSLDADTKIFRAFRNGILKTQYTIPALDGLVGTVFYIAENSNISELLLIQKCLHTTNFTPPTEPYIWLDKPTMAEDKYDNLYGYK